jgi:hypothetical protein
MIVGAPVRGREADAGRAEGNASDTRYLTEALAALEPIVAACGAGARSARPDVRALARAARSEETVRHSAISGVLHDWGWLETAHRQVSDAEALVGLEGESLDRAFVERLVAGTQASIAGAHAEMVVGASRSARLVARHAIHAGYRQLAALEGLLPAETREAVDTWIEPDSMDRWSDDGGPGPRSVPAQPLGPGGS